MGVDLIFKIAAIGILVAVLNLILVRSGRDEQALLTTLAGLIVVLVMLLQQISDLFDLVKQLCCKVKSCSRCCRRTVMLCINCLISVLVLKLMCDIWREWHLSQLVKDLLEYSIELKSDESVALLNYIDDLTNKFALYKSCLRVRFI